jgi:predicted enzyme related to lactoylglutathione lyase
MRSSSSTQEIAMTTPARHHAIHWFEIPVHDIARAQSFYETLLGVSLRREQMGPQTMAIFPYGDGGIGGALLLGENAPAPGAQGVLVYLNAEPSIDAVLARVQDAGGRILSPKLELPGDIGFIAQVVDTEGNRIGLHTQP